MFEETTEVDIDPPCRLLTDEDILEETILVQEEWLEDEVTQVTPPTSPSLQVYYFVCPPATDADLVADFAWQVTTYLMCGSEQFVCTRQIDGFDCQVYRCEDGFVAQPIG